MASSFPGAIDNFTDPLANSSLASPSHAGQHSDLNDAVEKIETYMGLVKVDSTTFSATTTPFINGCFSSLYRHYRILISITGSTGSDVRFRVRSATSTPETAAVYDRWGYYSGASAMTFSNAANQTNGFVVEVANLSTAPATAAIDIYNPNVAVNTNVHINAWGAQTGAIYTWVNRIETTTQYTGFEITADSGTLTGSIAVYGYRN